MAEANADFYERKIMRLEEDLELLQEELTKVRFRLRNAEDFEIKYHILLKTTQAEIYKLQDYQSQADKDLVDQTVRGKLQQNNQIWEERIRQLQASLRQQSTQRIASLQSELLGATSRLKELAYRQEQMQLFEFKLKKAEKQNDSLLEQLQQMKRYYEKQKESEIMSLRNHLNSNFRQKLSNQRNTYENKISALQKKIIQMDINFNDLDNEHVDNSHSELTELKQRHEERIKSVGLELQDLNRLVVKKNQEIKSLLKQKSAAYDRNKGQVQHYSETIKELEQQLLRKQREHSSQLTQVLRRNRESAESQIAEYKSQIDALSQDVAGKEQALLDNTLNHDKQLERLAHSFEQEKYRLNESRNALENEITGLREQLYERDGEKRKEEAGKLMQNLVDTNRQETLVEGHENGITFLQRQLKKIQCVVQEKNRIISRLSEKIQELQLRNDRDFSQLNDRLRQQIKKNQERISECTLQIQQLHHQLNQKQREIVSSRQAAKQETQYLQSQIQTLKQQIQSLENDCRREVESKSATEASYRELCQKLLASKSELNQVKSKQWLEIERQRNQFQVVYRRKEQQFISKYDHSVQFQKQDINQLTHRHLAAEKETELLKKENQRLLSQLEKGKENRGSESYSKKIATLNLQIALSRNILDNVFKSEIPNSKSQVPIQRMIEIDASNVQSS